MLSPLIKMEKFQWRQTINVFKVKCITQAYNLYNNNSDFNCPIYTFSLAENISNYTPTQDSKREKSFNPFIFKGKNTESGGN